MPTREHSLDNPTVDGATPLTQREVAVLLGVSTKRVRELVDEGRLEERTNGRHPTGVARVEYNAVQVARLAVWRKLKIASLEREKRLAEVNGEKAQPFAVDAEDAMYQRYFERLGQSTRRHERFIRERHRRARARSNELGPNQKQSSCQPKDETP
jgi:excisionase family DNA binding protein